MSGWLTAKRKINYENKPPKIKYEILPEFKYPKKFESMSPPPTPKPKRMRGWKMSPLTPIPDAQTNLPPPPPSPRYTEADLKKGIELFERIVRQDLSDSPSPPQQKRNTDTDSIKYQGYSPMLYETQTQTQHDSELNSENIEETPTQHESVFNLEESTQHASETETPTQKVDSHNGGKMTRKKDKNKSKKGKSKSKKGKSKSKKGKNKRTIKRGK
jgi:hypothetical protein